MALVPTISEPILRREEEEEGQGTGRDAMSSSTALVQAQQDHPAPYQQQQQLLASSSLVPPPPSLSLADSSSSSPLPAAVLDAIARQPGVKNVILVSAPTTNNNNITTNTTTNTTTTNTTTNNNAPPPAFEFQEPLANRRQEGSHCGFCMVCEAEIINDYSPTGRNSSYFVCENETCTVKKPWVVHTNCLQNDLGSLKHARKLFVEYACDCGEKVRFDPTLSRARTAWLFIKDWPWFLLKWMVLVFVVSGLLGQVAWYGLVVSGRVPVDVAHNMHLLYEDKATQEIRPIVPQLNWHDFSRYKFCFANQIQEGWACRLYDSACSDTLACSPGGKLFRLYRPFDLFPVPFLDADLMIVTLVFIVVELCLAAIGAVLFFFFAWLPYNILAWAARRYRTYKVTRIKGPSKPNAAQVAALAAAATNVPTGLGGSRKKKGGGNGGGNNKR